MRGPVRLESYHANVGILSPVMSTAKQDGTIADNEDNGRPDVQPDVVYSKVFEQKDIMKVLMYTIVCGVTSLDKMSENREGPPLAARRPIYGK